MTRTIVDVHLLHTVPPSNLNRDDTGSPKSATYGGVTRARVSSQAWKRATRSAFAEHLDKTDLGTRTKRVVELVAERIEALGGPQAAEERLTLAAAVLTAAGITVKEPKVRKGVDPKTAESGYLLFLSALQVDALARLAVDTSGEIDKKAARALLKGDNSIDLALFGRMVADAVDLNVDASCQVAHALSTHAVTTEFDYFTAVDDHKKEDAEEDAGAGMIGTVEFSSSTLYRYATVDVDLLRKNLGDDDATLRALEAFLRAFTTSMPTGKQNTFANRTLPDALVVSVRQDRPVSYVGAFETPVRAEADGGRVRRSAHALATYAEQVVEAFAEPAVATVVVGVGDAGAEVERLGERLTFDAAVQRVSAAVAPRLGVEAS